MQVFVDKRKVNGKILARHSLVPHVYLTVCMIGEPYQCILFKLRHAAKLPNSVQGEALGDSRHSHGEPPIKARTKMTQQFLNATRYGCKAWDIF
jgi:hypothetical protein